MNSATFSATASGPFLLAFLPDHILYWSGEDTIMIDQAPGTILIVDDDPVFLDLLRSYVRACNLPFVEAHDGQEALDKLREERFALVISDLQMPGISGLDLLREVQEHFPETGVIIITGYGDPHSYTEVIQSGAIDFLAKPFFRDELEAKINRALREQRLINEMNSLVKTMEQQLAEKNATIGEVRAQLRETAEKVKQLQARTVLTTYGPHRIR
jgi:two-component system response regulator HydG